MKETHVVIMAGGVGSRLWPLSTPELPKQFIDLLGIGRTMLQLTTERFSDIVPSENFWIVTSADYMEIVKKQLPFVPQAQILLEPEPRSTAPCIAYACQKIAVNHPDAVVVVTPADAIILRTERFVSIIKKAVEFASESEKIVTIGIKPDKPETGYGYISAETGTDEENIVKVNSFKEKPDKELAKKYVDSGAYYWNAGIFVWKVSTINEQIAKHAPQIWLMVKQMSEFFYTDAEQEAVNKYFPLCEKISIDYAVMEKSPDIYMIAGDLGWNDLGSWSSVGKYLSHTEGTNGIVGENVKLFDCHNCIIHASDSKKVVVQGLEGYIVAVKSGNVLICKVAEEQKIKEFSK